MKSIERGIVTNIIKVRRKKDIRQATIAAAINVDNSTYSKIESGQVSLSISRLAEIASFFNMSMIDVITYPKHYVCLDDLPTDTPENKRPKVLVQLEVEYEKRDEVLRIILGEDNLRVF